MATKVKFGVALFPTEAAAQTVEQGKLAEKIKAKWGKTLDFS